MVEEAAERNDIIPCYFNLKNVNPNIENITALVKVDGVYIEQEIPVPRVMYNLLWTSPRRQRKIRELTSNGVTVFNEMNIRNKNRIHTILVENKKIRQHLPETKVANVVNLKEMMQKYDQLILKPDTGLISRGIMKLEKMSNKKWCLSYKSTSVKEIYWRQIFFERTIPKFLLKTITNKIYLAQNLLSLATYQGDPFDFRVATQRNGSGKWEVTAIIGKIALEGDFSTNIELGGSPYTLEELLLEYPHLKAEKIRRKFYSLAVRIADQLGKHFPHIADLGFDFAITPQGDIYFIECNFISDYKGFAINDGVLLRDEWQAVFTTPVDYARYLLINTF